VTHKQEFVQFIVAVVALVAPAVAAAQSTPPTAANQGSANQGGPMIIEQVEQHFALAPEYKVSKFGNSTAQLVGAHAGVFVTKGILIGGGLYTMTNGEEGRGLTYGGVVVGWEPWSVGRIGVDLRGLVGMGRGTSSETVTLTTRDRRGLIQGTREGTRWLTSDLVVAEPQVDLLFGLTKHLHLSIGGGYRFTSAERVDNDQFAGASGSVALRIGSAR
jgi:hypothetical protein